jgi:hypothetical protein
MAIPQLSSHVFGAVADVVSELSESLLELSEELGGGALGCAVGEVEDCSVSEFRCAFTG